jgi:hypothetical protein
MHLIIQLFAAQAFEVNLDHLHISSLNIKLYVFTWVNSLAMGKLVLVPFKSKENDK